MIFARRFEYFLLLRRAKIFGHHSQNNSQGCFVHCVRIPVCILGKAKTERLLASRLALANNPNYDTNAPLFEERGAICDVINYGK